MATKTKRSAIVARIAKTLSITVDGTEVHMPVGKLENQMLNCLLISQVRQMAQDNIKKIKDMDGAITPRELKDLIDSVANLAKSSSEIYSEVEGEIGADKQEKTAEKSEQPEDEDDFIDITQPKQDPNGQPNRNDPLPEQPAAD